MEKEDAETVLLELMKHARELMEKIDRAKKGEQGLSHYTSLYIKTEIVGTRFERKS